MSWIMKFVAVWLLVLFCCVVFCFVLFIYIFRCCFNSCRSHSFARGVPWQGQYDVHWHRIPTDEDKNRGWTHTVREKSFTGHHVRFNQTKSTALYRTVLRSFQVDQMRSMIENLDTQIYNIEGNYDGCYNNHTCMHAIYFCHTWH